METTTLFKDHDQYTFARLAENALLFTWKHVPGIGLEDFRNGIVAFADECKTERPGRAVVDARQLDPNSAAMGWVSGQVTPPNEEEYNTWWGHTIAPVYAAAGVAGLGTATGDPNSPGEVELPVEVGFKVGYFADVESVIAWDL